MTRRGLLFHLARAEPTLIVPVRRILDASARIPPAALRRFDESVWQQAIDTFASCDIFVRTVPKAGDIWRPPFREPVISGLERGAVNVVITDRIPMQWDQGRGLAGVTALYRGFHLAMVSVAHATRNMVPFVTVNTCVHELLHVLTADIFEQRPRGVPGQSREARIDALATRMWLFRDGSGVRSDARRYLARLRS